MLAASCQHFVSRLFFKHVVSRNAGVLIDHGTPPNKRCFGIAINDAGDIVGSTSPISPPIAKGFSLPANSMEAPWLAIEIGVFIAR